MQRKIHPGFGEAKRLKKPPCTSCIKIKVHGWNGLGESIHTAWCSFRIWQCSNKIFLLKLHEAFLSEWVHKSYMYAACFSIVISLFFIRELKQQWQRQQWEWHKKIGLMWKNNHPAQLCSKFWYITLLPSGKEQHINEMDTSQHFVTSLTNAKDLEIE